MTMDEGCFWTRELGKDRKHVCTVSTSSFFDSLSADFGIFFGVSRSIEMWWQLLFVNIWALWRDVGGVTTYDSTCKITSR
jgi:hypothetical protein